MATAVVFEDFPLALAKKLHDLSADTFKVAYCAAANTPDATLNTKLADLTEVDYTYAGSRALTISSLTQTAGTLKWILDDLVVAATGGAIGPFQYVVIYNDTAALKNLICYYDLGVEVTVADGQTFTHDFDNVNGIFQNAPAA